METQPEVVGRASELVTAVREHKSSIRRHRLLLSQAKAELSAIEAACRARGIRLIINPHQAKGTNPWPGPSSSTSIP